MKNFYSRRTFLLVFFLSIIALTLIFLGYSDQKSLKSRVEVVEDKGGVVSTLVKNLEIPWEIAFLPDGRILVTERPGRLLIIDSNAKQESIKEVAHVGEGGLLGMVLHPNYEETSYIYLYYTYHSGIDLFNKVVRYRFTDDRLVEDRVILDKIPASENHDGGRMIFSKDGKLYISIGDAQRPHSAQDLESLSGKILRVNDDGSIPDDNPFKESPVFSYGHRNVQGLAWDESGQLWVTEHGPEGLDEINRIDKGANYGWPEIGGDEKGQLASGPVVHSRQETWAPSGGVIHDGTLYFGGLAGRAVYGFNLETYELKKFFEGQFGRVRNVAMGPDGYFYVLTSNRDGRNKSPSAEDDRIIKIAPSFFEGSF